MTVSLVVGVGAVTALVFALVNGIFDRFGPAVAEDLNWKTQRGAVELAGTVDIGIVLDDAALVQKGFREFMRSKDVLYLGAVQSSGKLVTSYGEAPEGLDAAYLADAGTLYESDAWVATWAPAMVEGMLLGKVVMVVSKRRLAESEALRRNILISAVLGALACLVGGLLFINFFLLRSMNRDLKQLFNSLAQGVFSFGSDRVVRGNWSTEAERIFQAETLQEKTVDELLVKRLAEWDPERGVLEQWLDLVFQADESNFQELAELAPSEVTLDPDSENPGYLRLEFRPVVEKGVITKVMCLALDVSEQKQAEAEALARDAEARKQIALLKNLSGGGAEFVRFLRDTEHRWEAFGALLGDQPRALKGAEVEELFQIAHTVKGDSRLFDLGELEDCAAQVEEFLAVFRERAQVEGEVDTAESLLALRSLLDQMGSLLEQTKAALVDASPIGEAVLDQTTVRRSLLDRLIKAVEASPSDLRRLVHLLASRPFGESVNRLGNVVPTWAGQRGKLALLDVQGHSVGVPGHVVGPLSSALTHLIRNSVVHGIEQPDQREAGGKQQTGTISVVCTQFGDGIRLVIEDDGGGIDTAALCARAQERGLTWIKGREYELIFEDGLSTADQSDSFAGRGVGMSAVRNDLRRICYSLGVVSRPGAGTCFVIEPIGTPSVIPPGPDRHAA